MVEIPALKGLASVSTCAAVVASELSGSGQMLKIWDASNGGEQRSHEVGLKQVDRRSGCPTKEWQQAGDR